MWKRMHTSGEKLEGNILLLLFHVRSGELPLKPSTFALVDRLLQPFDERAQEEKAQQTLTTLCNSRGATRRGPSNSRNGSARPRSIPAKRTVPSGCCSFYQEGRSSSKISKIYHHRFLPVGRKY